MTENCCLQNGHVSKQYEFILAIYHFVSTHYTDSILVQKEAPSLLKHQPHQKKQSSADEKLVLHTLIIGATNQHWEWG